jgi:hypothetical protein
MPPPWGVPRRNRTRDFLNAHRTEILVVILLTLGYWLYRDMLNLFLVRVWARWITLLEGSVGTVALLLLQTFWFKKPIPAGWYAAIFLGFLFFGCFQAWEDEYLSKVGREKDLHNAELRNIGLQAKLDEATTADSAIIKGLKAQLDRLPGKVTDASSAAHLQILRNGSELQGQTIIIPGDKSRQIEIVINGGAIIDHRTPRERRFVAVAK